VGRPYLLLAFLASVPVAAQSNRVFVSALSGNDANACNNIATPCQTFQGAVSQVAAGGSILVLTTGGYGAVTISKALTIEAPTNVIAFIHPSSGDAITVNVGASDTVVLRGLSLNVGAGSGIVFWGGTLQVERCVLNGFVNAILHQSNGLLIVKDSTIRNSNYGIRMDAASPTGTRAVVERTRIKGNQNGVFVYNGVLVLHASNVSGNSAAGVFAYGVGGGAAPDVTVEDCLIAHNGDGADSWGTSGGIATLRVSNSTIVYNLFGLDQFDGGTLLSRSDNTVEGNTVDTSGTISSYFPK